MGRSISGSGDESSAGTSSMSAVGAALGNCTLYSPPTPPRVLSISADSASGVRRLDGMLGGDACAVCTRDGLGIRLSAWSRATMCDAAYSAFTARGDFPSRLRNPAVGLRPGLPSGLAWYGLSSQQLET